MESAAMPLWKKMLVVFSVLVMAGGVTGKIVGRQRKAAAPTGPVEATTVSPPSSARGFVAGGSATPTPAPTTPQTTPKVDGFDWEQWSPAIFRFGFSFFAGFCIAYALRAVLKVGLFVAGIVLIAALGLQYAGMLNIDWNSVAGRYDSVATWLQGQFGSFRDFLTGHLPSAGSAVAGMVMGFTR